MLIIIVSTVIISVGCTKIDNPPQQEEPPVVTKSLSDYFPLVEGNVWQYKGEGNEYASFTREVVFVEGDKAQIKDDNGGTVSTAVFITTDNEIVRIFFKVKNMKKLIILMKNLMTT